MDKDIGIAEPAARETDVMKIDELLAEVGQLSIEIRGRAFELHEPPLDEKKPPEAEVLEEPTRVGLRFIENLTETRGVLRKALEALKGFN